MTIEGYQKKHKMKDYEKTYKVLKTVNSNMPNIASASDAANSVSRKRKVDESPLSSPPNGHSEESAKISKQEKAFSKVHVPSDRPWYDGQEYECQVCQQMYYEVDQLLFHIRSAHEMTAKPYQKKYSKFETKKAFYECKICFNQVKHTKNGISNHVIVNHDGMTLKRYAEVFHPKVKNDLQPNDNGNSLTTKPLDSEAIFNKWSKGTCTFQCSICQFTSGGSVEFWKHIKGVHCMDIQAYKETHPNPCIVMNKITCKICSKVLRYDYGTLLGHASTRHSMKLYDFYDTFYKTEMEAAEHKVSRLMTSTSTSSSQSQMPQQPKEKEALNSNVEEVIIGGRYQAMDDLGKRVQAWAWKCRYRCKICNMSARSRVGAQKHINKTHDYSIKEYEVNYGSTLTKKVVHSCFICQKKVLHDPSCLSFHVKSIHKITLNDYFVNFIEKNPVAAGMTQVQEQARLVPKTMKSLPNSSTTSIMKGRKVTTSSLGTSRAGKILKAVKKYSKPSGNEPHYRW